MSRSRRRGVSHGARLAAALLLCACASRMPSGVEFDADVDFAAFARFAFAPGRASEAPAADVREARALARREIERQLTASGYAFSADPAAADLWIAVELEIFRRASGDEPDTSDARLAIELLPPGGGTPVWRGRARPRWRDARERDAALRDAVAELLGRYPPPEGPGSAGASASAASSASIRAMKSEGEREPLSR